MKILAFNSRSGFFRAVPVALLAATVFCSSAPPDEAPAVEADLPSISWKTFDSGLLEQAQQEGRPVIVYFHADWCVPCIELDRYTFSDPSVVESAESFIRTKVDWTDYASVDAQMEPGAAQLKDQYTVYALPTIIFLDAEGNEAADSRVIGYLDPEDFILQMERALPSS